MARGRRGTGLVVAGFVLAVASLVLGLLTAIPAIIVGIVVVTRGRAGAGAAIIVLAIALPVFTALMLFGVLKAHAYRTPSGSMEPTLSVGDRLVTTKSSDPARGDIV